MQNEFVIAFNEVPFLVEEHSAVEILLCAKFHIPELVGIFLFFVRVLLLFRLLKLDLLICSADPVSTLDMEMQLDTVLRYPNFLNLRRG